MNSSLRRGPRRQGPVLAAVALVVAGAGLTAACGGHDDSVPRARHGERTRIADDFAPYTDATYPAPFDMKSAARDTGVKDYTLAFVTAEDDSGHGEEGGAGEPEENASCHPTWGGTDGITDNPLARGIKDLRAAGGDVRVSFGGQAGTELALACPGVAGLTAAYSRVIDELGAERLDFDIELDALSDATSVTRRDKAIAALQRKRPGLDVSFTLPVMPEGLTGPGLDLLDDAGRSGVHISSVNIMAMDYGTSYDGDMAGYAERAADAAHAQLTDTLGLGGADAWHKLAVTTMVGANDIKGEVFTLADATRFARFAADKGIGRLSIWSAHRDRPCESGAGGGARPDCSSVDQKPGEFQRVLGAAP